MDLTDVPLSRLVSRLFEQGRRKRRLILLFINQSPGCSAQQVVSGVPGLGVTAFYYEAIQLERSGKIYSAWDESRPARDRRPREYYLTRAGKNLLKEMQQSEGWIDALLMKRRVGP